jgi:hypothetical protein
MTCFLTISVGESADSARPLLASTNPALVRHAIRGFFDIIDRSDRGEPALLELLAQSEGAAEYQWSQRDVDFELERADAFEILAAAPEPNSAVLGEELLSLAAWHRERARAVALIVQQRSDASGVAALVAVRRDPNGALYVAQASASDNATPAVMREADGSLSLVEASSDTAAEG